MSNAETPATSPATSPASQPAAAKHPNPAARPAPVKGQRAPGTEINTVNAILRRTHAPREHGTGGEVAPSYLPPVSFTIAGELQAEMMGGDKGDEFVISHGAERQSLSAIFYRKIWEGSGKPGNFHEFLDQIESLQMDRENCLHLGHVKMTIEFQAVQD